MKFIVTGPESSGKTFLVNQLSDHFDWKNTEEYARKYIGSLDRSYDLSDVMHIGKHQMIEAESVVKLYDTDVLTTYIWVEEKYGLCHLDWLSFLSMQDNTHYLLCKPDIPWQYDQQRENENDRDRLFNLHIHYLTLMNKSYDIIQGPLDERLNLAIQSILSRSIL
jgi:nicotinamide riboside kinase